jgi:DNA-binding transcriptional MerR regulator
VLQEAVSPRQFVGGLKKLAGRFGAMRHPVVRAFGGGNLAATALIAASKTPAETLMLMASKTYSARKMTKFARCTLGQLNYYHQIRLLLPRRVSPEGTYEYDDVNLLRLQHIRIGRAAGLALEEIRRLLDDCACRLPPLPLHARLPGPGRTLTPPSALYAETEAKVETDADRLAFQEEADQLYRALSALRRSGAAINAARVRLWVEAHRCHIDRWFCPCDAPTHLAFARAIAKNPHLAASIERHGSGLTSFMLSAIGQHAAREERE